jgi:uncharacterized protein (TIGR04255 family)
MSSAWPHLNHAPIVEAIIDFRVERNPNTELAQLDSLQSYLNDKYPTKKGRFRQQVDFKIEVGKEPAMDSSPKQQDGFLFSSADGKYIFQPQLDGFTLSRLAPYESWDILHEETKRLWNLYERVAKPQKIARVGVRYINKLPLPYPIESFEKYLTAPPAIPSGLPKVLKGFFSRILLPIGEIDSYATITQSLLEPEGEALPLILDIDLARPVGFPGDTVDAWNLLQQFHDWKNEIFFRSITQHMVQLCQ